MPVCRETRCGALRAHGRDAAGPARPRGRGSLDRPLSQRCRSRLQILAPRAVVAAENLCCATNSSCFADRGRVPASPAGPMADRDAGNANALPPRERVRRRPSTVLRWHRAGWRLWLCRCSSRQVGRPPISAELWALILPGTASRLTPAEPARLQLLGKLRDHDPLAGGAGLRDRKRQRVLRSARIGQGMASGLAHRLDLGPSRSTNEPKFPGIRVFPCRLGEPKSAAGWAVTQRDPRPTAASPSGWRMGSSLERARGPSSTLA
jgi:hypothetical protein